MLSSAAAASRRFAMPQPASSAPPHADGCGDDATTARAETSDGLPIEVSFVAADPPAFTRCVVRCSGLTAGEFSKGPPFIIGADGAFLVILVIFPCRSDRRCFTDFFVYRSGPGTPLLELLRRPYPVKHLSDHLGILSCGEHFLVVNPKWQFHADGQVRCDLHVFSSKTTSWESKVARLPCGVEAYIGDFIPTKVLSVEGRSIAWVDLWNGILLFDSVTSDPEVRLIQLPPLMPINGRYLRGGGLDDTYISVDPNRDITCSNGWFRFIEMGFPLLDGSTGQLNFRWQATMFKRLVRPEECQWEPCGTETDSAELVCADSCSLDLLPVIWDSKDNQLTFTNLIYEGYYASGWVLSVNTENKKLEKVSPFSKEILFFHRIYRQCDFLKHLGKAPESHLTKVLDKHTNREMIELLDTNLLAALEQLQNIETHIESLKRRYNWSMPLVSSNSASSLDPKIRYLLAPIDVTKSKIRVAHGALYKLMGTLPSDVLDKYFVERTSFSGPERTKDAAVQSQGSLRLL
uniref:DUF1618 domain-containing protein n=1 Tax=Oryza barthii TaxID=65489 RepID=A0A0D3FWJ2_9ORYZ